MGPDSISYTVRTKLWLVRGDAFKDLAGSSANYWKAWLARALPAEPLRQTRRY
jgi:hypothetical protein